MTRKYSPTIRLSIPTTPIIAGQPLSIGVSVADLNYNLASGTLAWGDGQTISWQATPPTSLSHTYVVAGTYTIAASVKDTTGMTGTAKTAVTVAPPPSPLPPPTPVVSPDCTAITPGVGTLTAGDGAVWALQANFATIRNTVHVGVGYGSKLEWTAAHTIQTLGTDSKWYLYSGGDNGTWSSTGAGDPCVVVPPPSPPTTSSTVLTSANFTYLGVLGMPGELSQYRSGATVMSPTLRVVGGEKRLLFVNQVAGGVYPNGYAPAIYEVTIPAVSPDATTITERGVVRRTFLDFTRGKMLGPSPWVPGQGQGPELDGICWVNGKLFWNYGSSYTPWSASDPSQGFSILNDDLSSTAYGPFRFGSAGSGPYGIKLRQYFATAPAAFATTYLGGHALCVGAGRSSGDVGISWGPMLAAIPEFTTGTPACDPATASNFTAPVFASLSEFGFGPGAGPGYLRRAGRPNDFVCHYNSSNAWDADGSYALSLGYGAAFAQDATTVNQPTVGFWTQNDGVSCAAWVDLGTKAGVLFFGSQGFGHDWYGNQQCYPHNLTDPGPTSQGTHTIGRRPAWWILDPADLAKVVGGTLAKDAVPMTSLDPRTLTTQPLYFQQYSPEFSYQGALYDADTGRLYLCVVAADPIGGTPPPVLIHVFQVTA